MVTLRSAKPPCAGSIPARASKSKLSKLSFESFDFHGRKHLHQVLSSGIEKRSSARSALARGRASSGRSHPVDSERSERIYGGELTPIPARASKRQNKRESVCFALFWCTGGNRKTEPGTVTRRCFIRASLVINLAACTVGESGSRVLRLFDVS